MKRIMIVLCIFTVILAGSATTSQAGFLRRVARAVLCPEFNDQTTAAMEQAKILSDYTPWIKITLSNDSGVPVETMVDFKFPTEVQETAGNDQLNWKTHEVPNTIPAYDKAEVEVPANWDIWVTYRVAGSGIHGPRVKHHTLWHSEIIKVVPPGIPEYSPPILGPYHPVCTHVLLNNWLDGEGSVKIVPPKKIVGTKEVRVTEGRDRVTLSDPTVITSPKPVTIVVGRNDTSPVELPPGKYTFHFLLDGKKYATSIYNVSGDGNLYNQRGDEITTTISFPEPCGEKYQPKYRVRTPYSQLADKK